MSKNDCNFDANAYRAIIEASDDHEFNKELTKLVRNAIGHQIIPNFLDESSDGEVHTESDESPK